MCKEHFFFNINIRFLCGCKFLSIEEKIVAVNNKKKPKMNQDSTTASSLIYLPIQKQTKQTNKQEEYYLKNSKEVVDACLFVFLYMILMRFFS